MKQKWKDYCSKEIERFIAVNVIPIYGTMIYILRSFIVIQSYKSIYPIGFLVTLLPLYSPTVITNLTDWTMYELTEDSNSERSIQYEPTEIFVLKDSVIVNMMSN